MDEVALAQPVSAREITDEAGAGHEIPDRLVVATTEQHPSYAAREDVRADVRCGGLDAHVVEPDRHFARSGRYRRTARVRAFMEMLARGLRGERSLLEGTAAALGSRRSPRP